MSPRKPGSDAFRAACALALVATISISSIAQSTQVKDINPGAAHSLLNGPKFIVFGGFTYFRATDGVNGVELWRTDGTTGNTTLVMDVNPGSASSFPDNFAVVGSNLFFTATTAAAGNELWKTDGVTTQLVKDINPGATGSSPGDLVEMGGSLYFAADDGTTGRELWTSDGTLGGTFLLKDIAPGQIIFFPPFSSNPRFLTTIGSTVYFSADDKLTGTELWKTNGTPGGTVLVKDIFPGNTFGPNASNPEFLTAVGTTLFFRATDGVNNVELWRSNGTAGTTVLVQDINPAAGTSLPQELKAVGTTLFFQADDGTNGAELWKCAPPYTSAALVKDISPGANPSTPIELANVNGVLYFQADDGTNGAELWKSDGTTGGTVMVKNIDPSTFPVPGSGFPMNIVAVGVCGAVFSANDGTGFELWRTDGTAAGTIRVQDILAGAQGSMDFVRPEFTLFGTDVLFAARLTQGVEPFKVAQSAVAGGAPLITVNPLGGTFCPGSTIVLSVTATGGGLSYQWRKNTVTLGGETNPTLTINGATAADDGSYDVVVTSSCGSVTSTAAVVVVADTQAPVITATGTTLTLGCNPTPTQIDNALGTATATDNCSSVTPTPSDSGVTSTGCQRSQTRTWNAVDASSNAATPVSRTVTWTEDTTAPVITASGTTLTLGCNPNAGDIANALGTATASDNCGSVTPNASTGSVSMSGCTASQTRTWTASDACGNPATPVSRTVTWTVDTTAPVITASGTTLALGCNPNATDIEDALGTATASDNCGPVTPSASTGSVSTSGCTASQTRTWTASDACGNPATPVSRTVTWTVDTTAPVITASGTTLTLGCNPNATDIEDALGTATASDNCGPVTPTASTGSVSISGCTATQTRTWTASDACSNPATPVSRTVTWTVDTTAPVITASGTTLALGCNPNATDIEDALGTATASDNCGPVTPSASTGSVSISGCTASQTRTWTASDACSNPATPVSRTVTWTVDTTAPVITASGTTLTLGCNPNATDIDDALGTATASDNCGPVTPSASTGSVSISGCTATQTRTWTASDACSNPATPVSRTVTWTVDTTAPVITASGTTLALGCNPNATDIEDALGTATASDNCGPVTPSASTGSVSTSGCTASQTRTWTASDACGNPATPVSRTVTWTVDTTAPVITASGTTLALGCNPNAGDIEAALGTATASDNCGPVTPTASTGSVSISGCTATQTRTWTASDACSNPATPVSRTVTWTVDTTAPVITASGTTLALGCNPNATDIEDALGTATASDNCGPVTPSASTGSVSTSGCTASQTRTWTASDACGNPATPVSRTVTWTVDTTAPVITASGTTLTLGCNPNATDIDDALGTATASDNCGPVTPTASTGSVSISGCTASQTRTWTASDACGNPATPVSRTVTWTVDTTAPVITASGTTLSLGCNPNAGDIEAALGTATATDNCGPVTPSASTGSVSTSGCTASQTRTWTASDACGNPATPVSRTVTWTVDTTAPVITAAGTTLTLGCNPNAGDIEAALGTATATDNCGPVTPSASTGSVSTSGCTASQTRTWTASDACGNPATPVSRTVTWTVDTTAPVITASGTTLTLGCNPTVTQLNAALGSATATDNCGPVTPTASDSSVTLSGCTASQTRTWTASDACGNPATPVSRTVTWTSDTTPPVAVSTGPLSPCFTTQTAAQNQALAHSSATDNCTATGSLVPHVSTSFSGCVATITVTFTDGCNNESNGLVYTTVVDATPPQITGCPTNITVPANADPCSAIVSWTPPTASDNCGTVSLIPSLPPGSLFPQGTTTVVYTAIDGCGLAASCSFTVTVQPVVPQVTVPPASQSICVNGTATFTVTATPASPTLSYQWRHDGSPIGGATASTLTISNATIADGGTYDVIVINGCGPTTSTPASLIVNTGPTIGVQPQASAVCIGANYQLSVGASGCAPVTYQWRKNGAPISGAISSSYTITNFQVADRAFYDVVVTDCCGSITSDSVHITALFAPQIVVPPPSRTVYTGASTTFIVLTNQLQPETYQWRKGTVPISGATGSTYTIPRVHLTDAGSYDVVVTNSCGNLTSAAATLNVLPFTLIFDQPFGPLSVRVQNVGGVAGDTYFSAFSIDPLNGTNPDQGPWFGMWITQSDLVQQFLFGFPPFVGNLDGSGGSFFALPANGLAPSLTGFTFYGVTLMADLSGPTIHGASNIPSLTVQ